MAAPAPAAGAGGRTPSLKVQFMLKRRNILLGGGLFALAGGGAAYAGIRQMGSMEEYKYAVATTRAAMDTTPEAAGIIRYATLAANSHNTQPWRFRINAAGIDILPDLSRRLGIVDPDDHHLYASLGCAAENLRIAASMRGLPGELHDAPDSAAVSFIYGKGSPAEPGQYRAGHPARFPESAGGSRASAAGVS